MNSLGSGAKTDKSDSATNGPTVGVLDKSVAILDALESTPLSLSDLVTATGLSRATAHRLAVALCGHGLVQRDAGGLFRLGPRLLGLAASVRERFLADTAQDILDDLRNQTGESAQLFVRVGGERLCVAVAESTQGLRTIVRVGEVLTMERGSAATALSGTIARGEAVASVAERQAGVASVSAPVEQGGVVVAAISVSGPIERLGTAPLDRHGSAVVQAANLLEARLADSASIEGLVGM